MFCFEAGPEPGVLQLIRERTEALGFDACSDARTGHLLRFCAALRPGGQILEIGTGTGMGAAWLLAGMDGAARLLSVDNDWTAQAVARDVFRDEPRAAFELMDGGDFIATAAAANYDLIFADSWPGKFTHLDETLDLLKPGGLYLIDDLAPQPNWPDGHQPKVDALIAALEADARVSTVRLDWSTGLMLATRTGASS